MKYKLFIIKYYFWIIFGIQVLGTITIQQSITYCTDEKPDFTIMAMTLEEESYWSDWLYPTPELLQEHLRNHPLLGRELTIYEEMNGPTDNNTGFHPVISLDINTPSTYYVDNTSINNEINMFKTYLLQSIPRDYEETRAITLHYVKEHFPNNVWATNDKEVASCNATHIVKTISELIKLRNDTDISISFLIRGISTINAGIAIDVMNNQTIINSVFDNGLQNILT